MSLLSPQLQAFMAVAKAGSVQHAAKSINLTQTGVTQRIRALELLVGVGLFKRSRKGMLLTAEGTSLLLYCQRALELEGETWAQLSGTGADNSILKRVIIAGPSSMLRARIISDLKPVCVEHSNVRLTFRVEENPNACLSLLKDGAVDFAVVPREYVPKELDSKVIRNEEYILAVPTAWQHRTLAEIVASEILIDFDPDDRVSLDYLEKTVGANSYNGERHFVNNTDALASMIETGMGYSVLSREFAAPLIASGRLVCIETAHKYEIRFALSWYPRSTIPAYLKSVMNSIT